MASGLLVTGGSASLAFASPDDGGTAGGGDTTSGETAGGQPEHSPGPSATEPTTTPGSVIGGATGSTGAPKPSTKPTSTVGNGRTGVEAATPHGIPAAGIEIKLPGKLTLPKFGIPDLSGILNSGKPVEEAPLGGAVVVDGTEPTVPSGATDLPGLQAPEALLGIDPAAADPQLVDPVLVDPNLLEIVLPDGGSEQPGESVSPEEQAGWPWSWWNWNPPPAGNGGDSNGALPGSPLFNDPVPPLMQIPLLQIPGQVLQGISDIAQPFIEGVVTGLATAASHLPFAPTTLPVIVPPATGVGSGAPGGDGGGAGGATAPDIPRFTPPAAPEPELTFGPPESLAPAPPAGQQTPPPASPMSSGLLPAPTYRMGYVDYLRAAGLGEVAAVAVPGVTGILVLTSAGGLIGFRQARAGRAIRAGGPARFMG
jgi:hypothetical protein